MKLHFWTFLNKLPSCPIGETDDTTEPKYANISLSSKNAGPVERQIVSIQDLIKIGRGIGEKTCAQLTDPLIPDLAEGYMAVYKTQIREYLGLRDFYSLVKLVSALAKDRKHNSIIETLSCVLSTTSGATLETFILPTSFFEKHCKVGKNS